MWIIWELGVPARDSVGDLEKLTSYTARELFRLEIVGLGSGCAIINHAGGGMEGETTTSRDY